MDAVWYGCKWQRRKSTCVLTSQRFYGSRVVILFPGIELAPDLTVDGKDYFLSKIRLGISGASLNVIYDLFSAGRPDLPGMLDSIPWVSAAKARLATYAGRV